MCQPSPYASCRAWELNAHRKKQAWHPLYCHPAGRQCTAVHHGLGQQWGSRVSEGFSGAEPIKCAHLLPERACHCGCHALPRDQDVEPAHHPQQVQQPLEECAPPLTCLCSAATSAAGSLLPFLPYALPYLTPGSACNDTLSITLGCCVFTRASGRMQVL